MSEQALILERLDRIEQQLAPLAATARSVSELRDELAPRVNEAVHALIEQLAEVEADFQLEDLLYLIKKLMRNTRNLNFTLDQLKNLIDFVMTAEPLMKITVPQAIFYLDALERQGVFRLLNTGIDVIGRIGSRYSADELQQMADGLVRLVAILQKLTAPAALDLLDRAAGLPERMNLEEAAPAGAKTLLGVMGDPDFRQGMGVLLELTRGLAHLKA
jgi:uncharacterized protein YjgD (DUF1641 family)